MANMIEWKPVIIGVIIALIVDFLLFIQGLVLNPAFLLAGIAVGFMTGGTWKNGAINGTIAGILGVIIFTVILTIIYAGGGAGALLGILLAYLVPYLILRIILAIVGGIIGFFIVAESEKHPIEE